MEGDGGDPSSINKNPKVIKGAQDEIAVIDVLVCGTCRSVFHFIEEFQEHKRKKLCGVSTFKANLAESKPQVWAFLLWKSAIVNQQRANDSEPVNSWKLYQRWCKMADNVRDLWVAAGEAIQCHTLIANAKMQEVHNKLSDGKSKVINTKLSTLSDEDADDEGRRPKSEGDLKEVDHKKMVRRVVRVVDKNGSLKEIRSVRSALAKEPQVSKRDTSNGLVVSASQKEETRDADIDTSSQDMAPPCTMEEMEETTKGPELDTFPTEEEEGEEEKEENISLPEMVTPDQPMEVSLEKKLALEGEDSIEIKEEKLSEEEEEMAMEEDVEMQALLQIRKRPVIAGTNKVARRSLNKDSQEGSSEDEYVVEKILAKRFNPRRKYFEYLLKWEGYPHDQNTWEPVHNMAACDKLVETFERNLARQKATQAQALQQQQQQLQKAQAQINANQKIMKAAVKTEIAPGPSNSESRPVRSSKKKALEQVKSWCGTMAKVDLGKRKAGESSEDSEDDRIPEKKVKLEPPDDDDWSSGGDLGEYSGSSEEGHRKRGQHILGLPGPAKMMSIIHRNKDLMAPLVKRSPGRPRKIRPEMGAVNGVAKGHKGDEANDLAVKLGLESDSSPENKLNSQPPVLVANSKGVIKVDPRQVPNLTSGVYIVANKSGVVKLESLPGSPTKGKILQQVVKQTHGDTGNKQSPQTGVIRKPLVQQSASARLSMGSAGPVRLLPKPGTPSRPGISPGLIKLSPTQQLKTLQRPGLPGGPRPPIMSPRVLGPRPPRPSSVLGSRTLLSSTLKPLAPKPPGIIGPSSATPGIKKLPIGIPGVQTKITSAVRPRMPMQGGKILSPLTAQTKSGIKPIHAMLGKAMHGQSAVSALVAAKKQQQLQDKDIIGLQQLKLGMKGEGVTRGRGRGRGRGSGGLSRPIEDIDSRQRDSKLVDSDGVHMEFHEVSSNESESEDSLSGFPMGELPSLEPESPPRPFTLCPLTGKILSRAEGEPTPPPSPEPVLKPPSPLEPEPEEILPDQGPGSPLHYSGEGETLLKVEMSPGGTTGTVVESSTADTTYLDTLRTEQGLTVTKIADTGAKGGSTSPQVSSAVQVSNKAGGGISVPARKLFVDAGNKPTPDIVTVTGDDGVVYQISTDAGQDDLEQQCVYVTTDQTEGGEDGAVLTLDTAVAEAVAQLMPDQVNVIGGSGCSQFYIKEGEEGNGASDEQLVMASVVDGAGSGDESSQAQVVAHVVQEGELIPGTGKRRVVLLLPDGNLMMTEVDEEQYAALNLDK